MESAKTTAAPAEDTASPVLSLCCGGRKCPVFTKESDGVRLTDAEKLGEDSIPLTAADATALREWLQKHGF